MHIESLERRRLLSLALVGADATVPTEPAGEATCIDVAVAADGSYLVASDVFTLTESEFFPSGTTTVQVVRYSSAGQQLGAPITLAAFGAGSGNIGVTAKLSAS